MTFEHFGLNASLLRAINTSGYTQPTPVQMQAIPAVMQGSDLIGTAQTGTGKTAAFALPILHNLHINLQKNTKVRCLVLTPTRELAIQVADSFRKYGQFTRLKVVTVFGGVSIIPQKAALKGTTDVLVATPGRLLDLISQHVVDLSQVEIFVLDEADRMFDMGFIKDVRRIIALIPKERQTLMFSATMPTEINTLAATILKKPIKIQVAPEQTTAKNVKQFIYSVDLKQKTALLQHLIIEHAVKRAIVFVRMKHHANRIVDFLKGGGITCEAFHSNKSQNARQRTLALFKTGKVQVLVATDIAARGLDIDGVDVVVNYDLPEVPETYVHRIGRTGRADAHGLAWSFCNHEQRHLLKDIERTIEQKLEIVPNHPFLPSKESSHDSLNRLNSVNGRPNFVSERKPAAPRGGKVRPSGTERSRQNHPVSHHHQ